MNFFQTGAAHDTDPFANLTQQDHAIPSVPSTLPMMPPAVVSSQMPPPSVSPQVPPPAMLPPSSTPPMFNTSGSGTVDHVDAPPPRGEILIFLSISQNSHCKSVKNANLKNNIILMRSIFFIISTRVHK